MLSMITFCKDMQELLKIKIISKNTVAVLSEDKWFMEFYNRLEEFKNKIKEGSKQDIICYDLEEGKGIDYATYIRKCYEHAMLILMADESISPMEYIRPDIMPAGLIMKPATDESIEKVIWDVFESYMEKIEKKGLDKAYIVSLKEEKITIPYSKILYFEARNKKIYIRYDNEEIGFYESIDNIEKELSKDFIRTHRSFIVNRRMIRKIKLTEKIVVLNSSIEVPLSRKYKNEVKVIDYGR